MYSVLFLDFKLVKLEKFFFFRHFIFSLCFDAEVAAGVTFPLIPSFCFQNA